MDTTPDLVFSALAHPARRRMLDLLVHAPGANLKEIASHFDMSRIAVMKHLAVLEAAELVLSEKDGRVRQHYFNPIPIQLIYERWTTEYSSFWAGRMTKIQARVEARAKKRRKKIA